MKDGSLSQSEIEALLREVEESESVITDVARRPNLEASSDVEVDYSKEKAAAEKQAESTDDTIGAYNPRNQKTISVKPARFEELEPKSAPGRLVSDIDLLMDIPLAIAVELGKAKCYVKDLLNLTIGSIVELDKLAGDPVDILVNGKLFAKGEVVVIDENFGVRIQEIVNKDQTIT